MDKKRILFVSQEITPYTPEKIISTLANQLPQDMNEQGFEVRIFMPRYGCINERRHQLHEVIRLSGMNLPINDMDQPLIIKVASIPNARIQVYFIDNDEYFKRKSVFEDAKGNMHPDNDERALFFNRGVLETVKKLGWSPDVIHCHGWMTSLMPIYLRTQYADDQIFAESKIVSSVYAEGFEGSLNAELINKAKFAELDSDVEGWLSEPTFNNLSKIAAKLSDGVVMVGDVADEVREAVTDAETMDHTDEEMTNRYKEFFNEILIEETVA